MVVRWRSNGFSDFTENWCPEGPRALSRFAWLIRYQTLTPSGGRRFSCLAGVPFFLDIPREEPLDARDITFRVSLEGSLTGMLENTPYSWLTALYDTVTQPGYDEATASADPGWV